MDPEIQTRGNDGKISFWPTIAAAMVAAENDTTIWKISWTDQQTQERVRLVRRKGLVPGSGGQLHGGHDVWVYEPIVFPKLPSR